METSTPPPPPAPGPLTRWQWTWRNLCALGVGAVIWGNVAADQWAGGRSLFWLDIALGAASMVLVQYRRRWPFAVAMVTNVMGALSASASGAILLATVSMATRRRWSEIIPVALTSTVAGQIFLTSEPMERAPWLFDLVLSMVVSAISVAIGMYIGARRELVATLHDRAERAEREQALRVAQARSTERARIAREMHDVLAHRISLVAMHAGALVYRTDLSREETTEAAEIIQSNAHRALTDLREILGLLRDDDVAATPERPQPTLRDLPLLLAEERGAGARVRLTSTATALEALPESTGRNAYRMIQECLTNARKHAPDTTVDIVLSGEPGDRLILQMRNPLRLGAEAARVPGAGLGLIGLSERAALSGGELRHELTRAGEFVVQAWLPWPA